MVYAFLIILFSPLVIPGMHKAMKKGPIQRKLLIFSTCLYYAKLLSLAVLHYSGGQQSVGGDQPDWRLSPNLL